MKASLLAALMILLFLSSCVESAPNINADGENKIASMLSYTDQTAQTYHDTVYVPIYSDIYSEHRLSSILLTATLSIRSTSLTDTTYINSIDYYNTEGTLVRSYIDRTLILGPMQSVDYVIEKDDNTGGTGANFLLTWGADKNTKPIFQAVMLSTAGQHGMSFVTNGVSVKD